MTSTSYPVSAEDWRGRFIANLAAALAQNDAVSLSLWAPPGDLPDPEGRTVVLQCAGGKRSGKALDQCAAAQSVIDTHLAGGIGAWKDAGMPVVGS